VPNLHIFSLRTIATPRENARSARAHAGPRTVVGRGSCDTEDLCEGRRVRQGFGVPSPKDCRAAFRGAPPSTVLFRGWSNRTHTNNAQRLSSVQPPATPAARQSFGVAQKKAKVHYRLWCPRSVLPEPRPTTVPGAVIGRPCGPQTLSFLCRLPRERRHEPGSLSECVL